MFVTFFCWTELILFYLSQLMSYFRSTWLVTRTASRKASIMRSMNPVRAEAAARCWEAHFTSAWLCLGTNGWKWVYSFVILFVLFVKEMETSWKSCKMMKFVNFVKVKQKWTWWWNDMTMHGCWHETILLTTFGIYVLSV